MRYLAPLLTVLWVVLRTVQPCPAADEVLTFAAQEDYAPFQYYDQQGAPGGLDVEIIQEAAKLAGVRVSFTLVPWVRALNMAKQGQVDGVFGCGKKTEREEFLLFPDVPVRHSEMVFFANDRFQGEISNMKDVGDLKVGCIVDYFVSKEFNEATSINKDFANSTEALFLKLAANRHPLAVYNRHAGWHMVKKLQIENVRALPFVIASYPAYLAFSKSSPKGKLGFEKFSKALKQLQEDGTIEKKYREYLLNGRHRSSALQMTRLW